MRSYLIGFLLLLTPLFASAQLVYGFQQEYFFGWLPSPKTDAMAKADVAVGGSVASMFRNPAGLGLIDRAEFTFSSGGPYYLLKKSDYYFIGGAWKFHKRFTGALTVNQLAIGPTTFDVTINGVRHPLDKPKTTNVALSVAGSPVKNLHIGMNFNLWRWKLFDDVSPGSTFHLDLGALYTISLDGNSTTPQRGIRLGAAVNNITSASVTYASPDGDEDNNELPTIGRYGVSYFNDRLVKLPGAGQGNLGVLLTLEIQNVFNSDFRTGFAIGSETEFYDVFAFRLGFYTLSQNDFGNDVNKDRISALTYGFGLIMPLEKMTNQKLPVNVHFDFTSLRQPRVSNSGNFIPNVRSFAFRVVWTPKQSSAE
ncbi:MAG: hypothetical protein AAF502_08750 [Bacteroidota bacterium]